MPTPRRSSICESRPLSAKSSLASVTRHIGKHIPGHPTVLPKNMEGAGGTRLANWLYNVGARDGTVIGAVSRAPASAMCCTRMPSRVGECRGALRLARAMSGSASSGRGPNLKGHKPPLALQKKRSADLHLKAGHTAPTSIGCR
jgi:hypothetical protein